MVVPVTKRTVWVAVAALVGLSIYGAYQGWERSAADSDVTASTDGLLPATSPVAARQASALVEPPPPILTETQIRTIARQEVQAALGPKDEPAPSSPSAGAAPASPIPAPAIIPTPAPIPAPAELPPLY